MEKEGGRKTSRMIPLPKRGFGPPPPPRSVRFPPPSGVSALFFLYKNSGTFFLPLAFCNPPPYHGPTCCTFGKSCNSRTQLRSKTIRARLRGRTRRGQTEPKRRFSLIFADSRLLLETKHLGFTDFRRKPADFRRKPQRTAGTRRKPLIGVCPLGFVP